MFPYNYAYQTNFLKVLVFIIWVSLNFWGPLSDFIGHFYFVTDLCGLNIHLGT
jgi:hypothetical protein